ncbi:hypothetical protein Tco_1311294 [Tanacetum coccineum]
MMNPTTMMVDKGNDAKDEDVLSLAEKLDRLAGQLVAGGRSLKSVNVTYAYARATDDLATRLLRDMVAKGIHISEEQVDQPGIIGSLRIILCQRNVNVSFTSVGRTEVKHIEEDWKELGIMAAVFLAL